MDNIWTKQPSEPRRPIDRSAFAAKFEREMRELLEELAKLETRSATIERTSAAEVTLAIRPHLAALAA